MIGESGFDSQQSQLIFSIATNARTGKEYSVKSPTVQRFDLTGLSESEIQSTHSRLIFPKKS